MEDKKLYCYTESDGHQPTFCVKWGKSVTKYAHIVAMYQRAMKIATDHGQSIYFDDKKLKELFVKINKLEALSYEFEESTKKKEIDWVWW